MYLSIPQLLQSLQQIRSSRSDVISIICTIINRIDRPLWIGSQSCNSFTENRGITESLDILDLYKGDSAVVKIIFEVFVVLIERDRTKGKDNLKTALLLHRLAQSKIIVESFKHHQHDKDIRVWGRFIIRNLERASALATIEVLSEITKAFELGISYEVLKEVYHSREKTGVAPNHARIVQMASNPNEEGKAFSNKNLCQTGIEIVMKALSDYPENEAVQCKGLHIILQCIRHYSVPVSTFVNKECASVVIAAILKFDVYQIQWRAHTVMMELSSNLQMCAHLGAEGGCEAMMNTLSQSVKDVSLTQITVLTLNHLFKDKGGCCQKLIEQGLKQYLHMLLIKHSDDSSQKTTCPSIAIPLELHRFYKMTNLEIAKRFSIKLSVEPDEIKKKNKGLPVSKNLKPAHGIVKDLFIDGYPGLIEP